MMSAVVFWILFRLVYHTHVHAGCVIGDPNMEIDNLCNHQKEIHSLSVLLHKMRLNV